MAKPVRVALFLPDGNLRCHAVGAVRSSGECVVAVCRGGDDHEGGVANVQRQVIHGMDDIGGPKTVSAR